uniref:Uncharacterized protein n=1 Tax=Glossina austeni TaxID=7395 RepID=A0A1A9VSY0_GLOAU
MSYDYDHAQHVRRINIFCVCIDVCATVVLHAADRNSRFTQINKSYESNYFYKLGRYVEPQLGLVAIDHHSKMSSKELKHKLLTCEIIKALLSKLIHFKEMN